MRRRAFLGGVAAALVLPRMIASARAEERRVITLGSAVTETVFALGAGAEVVGVDASSVWPAEAASRAQVGYHRQLSAEGVLGLRPTHVLATDEAGPPAALSQLGAAGVHVVTLVATHDPVGASARIRAIGVAIGRRDESIRLATTLEAEFEAAARYVAADASRPRVLFVYARGAGTLQVAGRDNAADAMIALAGGVNAVTGFDGYRPLTPEAAVGAAPDVVLLTTRGATSVGGTDAVWALPGLALTPAGASRRLVVFDDLLLLGFGPRAGAGAQALAVALRARG
jgi:iron complex transport system substrate-binding protein